MSSFYKQVQIFIFILQFSVLEETKNQNISLYNRLRELIKKKDKHFYVFSNEHHKYFYIF
jgi:exosome complex exonuclease DIS3/RRP44